MIAVFALHHIAQKITSIDGDVLPLDWMPFVCSSAELSHDNIDIAGFSHHIARTGDLPSECSEWIAACNKHHAIHIYRPQSIASWWRLLDAPNLSLIHI